MTEKLSTKVSTNVDKLETQYERLVNLFETALF
jgi:hypothetical protein